MKILIGLDGSRFSDAAVQEVISRIAPAGAEVRLLHVVEAISFSPPPQMSKGYAPELEAQADEGRKMLEKHASALRAAGFVVDQVIENGDIREGILDAAAKWPADLIILGSHGRRGVRRFLLGSVAEFVVRQALCSVEVVRISANR